MTEFSLIIRKGLRQTRLKVHFSYYKSTLGDAVYQLKRAYYDAVMCGSIDWIFLRGNGHGTYRELIEFVPQIILSNNNIIVERIDEPYESDPDIPTVWADDILVSYEEMRMWQELEKMNLEQISSWLWHAIYFSKAADSLQRTPLSFSNFYYDSFTTESGGSKEEWRNILTLSRHYAREQWNIDPSDPLQIEPKPLF